MTRAAALLAVCLLCAFPGYAGEKPAAGGGAHSLRMEDLEVRGIREKPELLYLPVHRETARPFALPCDLFLADMARPVHPGQGGSDD